ncbi:alpha/beta fold hydrolase [Caballeronia arationis]|jgi:pimeloyl-ACP methyl ester carboxylesterase|nr:alpha/beta hydrolase [Caballeronia arationis]
MVVAAVCLMVACLVSACSGTGANREPARAASFQTITCPQPNIVGFPELDFPSGVQCGYLTVPENRAKPDGRRIRIFVMRAPAVSATPKHDPIVYLSGGPGGAGSFEVASMVRHGLNAERDVIFVDQRGTHRAAPLLRCPGWEQFLFDGVGLPFAAESSTAADAAAVKECRDQLAAAGVDLTAYNSTENAADIADLRVALGIDSWNVYGVSYGSRLALILLRDHPQGIRSVVLDSVSPPTVNIVETWWSAPASSFKAIFAACAAQASCAKAYPNLEADFTATVNRLDKTPVVTHVKDKSGALVTVNIDGFSFVYTIIMASERGNASGVPKMMAEMARGDARAVAATYLALRGPHEFVGLGGVGLALDVFCAESANLTTEAATLAKAKAALPGFPDRVLKVQPKQGRLFTECPVWNDGKADPAVSSRIVSDVPVLILEGTFDAATAPEWVDVITPNLRNAQLVPFPFTGHAVLGKSTCAPSIMAAFLDNPTKPVDPTCAKQIRLTFTTS